MVEPDKSSLSYRFGFILGTVLCLAGAAALVGEALYSVYRIVEWWNW